MKIEKVKELRELKRFIEAEILRLDEADEDSTDWEGLAYFIQELLPVVEEGKTFSFLSLSSSSDMGERKWSEERAEIQELPEGLLVKISRESSWAGDRPRGISGYHAYEEGEEKFLPHPVVVSREEKVWVPGGQNRWTFGVKVYIAPGKAIDFCGDDYEVGEIVSRLINILAGGEQ